MTRVVSRNDADCLSLLGSPCFFRVPVGDATCERSQMAAANDPDSFEVGTEEPRGDAELIIATRAGDTAAYGELYERHRVAATRLARILARDSAEADDLVSETFAKVLASLRDGRGPDLAFRAYLLTTLRHTFYDRVRRDKKVEFTDDMSK